MLVFTLLIGCVTTGREGEQREPGDLQGQTLERNSVHRREFTKWELAQAVGKEGVR